jgi:hypothetical protein
MRAADVVFKNLKIIFEILFKINRNGNLINCFKAAINSALCNDSIHTSQGKRCASVRNGSG